MMATSSKCAICSASASFVCIACKAVYYCGKEHQRMHWKSQHKMECKPFKIVSDDVLGRYMRATRNISKGEVILRELPLVCGPKIASVPICLGCHRNLMPPLGGNYYKCSKCTWPLCGADCENSPQHLEECKLMSLGNFNTKINYDRHNAPNGRKESAYCVIMPLRCLLLKEKSPDLFEQLQNLQDHLNEHMGTALYQVLKVNLVTFIRNVLNMNIWSEKDILRIASILDTNAFEVRQENVRVRAVYPAAAMFSHSCISNTRHVFDGQMQIIFTAKTAIAKGNILSISYTQPLKSTLGRRLHLYQSKCFLCTCLRCQDPSECGTFAGALLCNQCNQGKIVSSNPLDDQSVWCCQNCGKEYTVKEISNQNQQIEKAINLLDKNSYKALEEFLIKYKEILHDTNTYILQIKYALSQLYANILDGASNCSRQDVAKNVANRQVEICRQLLDIADVLDAGLSRFRGNLLLDLQQALVIQAKQQFVNGELSQEAFQKSLFDILGILQESHDILKFEPNMNFVFEKHKEELLLEINSIKKS